MNEALLVSLNLLTKRLRPVAAVVCCTGRFLLKRAPRRVAYAYLSVFPGAWLVYRKSADQVGVAGDAGEAMREIARSYNVSHSTISRLSA